MRLTKGYQKKKLMLQWLTAAFSILLGLSFEMNATAGYANPESLLNSFSENSVQFEFEKKSQYSDQYITEVHFSHENSESEPFEKELGSEDIAPDNWQEIKFHEFNTTIGSFQPINRSNFHKVPLYIKYRSLKIHLS